MSDIDGYWEIYRYDLSDESLTNISQGCATQCSNPAWSPDGEQILYELSVANDDMTSQGLWSAPADAGSKPKRYLAGEYSHPTMSSEGWIAFEGEDGIYRAAPGDDPDPQRYFYSDPKNFPLITPVWSH